MNYDTAVTIPAAENVAKHAVMAQAVKARGRSEEDCASLYSMFEQVPFLVYVLRGPGLNFEFANSLYRRLVGDRPLLGRSSAIAVSESDISVLALHRQVFETGEPLRQSDFTATADWNGSGSRSARYFDLDIQPVRALGQVDGVVVCGIDVTERFYIRQALGESEKRFRFFADSIPQLVWSAKPDGSTDYQNERMLGFHGLKLEEVVGDGWVRILHPIDVPKVMAAWAHAVATGKEYQIEYRLQRGSDGAFRWHLSRAVPMRDADGAITRWFGTCTDIHDQKWVQETNARLGKMIHAARDAILWFDLDGVIESWNPAAERIFGFTAAEAVGQSVSLLISADRRQEQSRILAQIRQGKAIPEYDTIRVRKDGSSIPLSVSIGLTHDADGHVTGAVATIRDLTDRLIAERAVRQSAEQLQLAVDATELGMFDWDLTTNMLSWSDRCRRIFDVPSNANIDVALFYARLHPDDRDHLVKVLNECKLPTASGEVRVQYRVTRNDGSTRWVDARGRVHFEGEGETRRAIRLIGTVQDITSRRDDEEELRRAKETAEAANRAKDRFLAVLSHELRTPLSPVAMTVSALELDPDLPFHMREELAMIRRNVELETRLIDDLLDLSRVISGKMQLHRQQTSLHGLIRHVFSILSAELHERKHHVRISLDANSDVVHADPARLQQVIWNLVKNATKFTPEGGRITIQTRNVGADTVELEINDNGRGIEAEVMPRIFDAFEQGEQSVTRKYGGLGLGLAIAKAIVDLHGGAISAHSSGVGMGATFMLRLMVVPQNTERLTKGGELGELTKRATKTTVLLVEDHVDTARSLRRLLLRSGYEVKSAEDVASAVKLAEREAFDVLISDIGLPDATGYELMQSLRKLVGSHVKGIAMSGYGMDEDVRKSYEVGFAEHLIKPVSFDLLEQAIRRIIGHGDEC